MTLKLLNDPGIGYWLYPEYRKCPNQAVLMADWCAIISSEYGLIGTILTEENKVVGGVRIVDDCVSYFVGMPYQGRGIGLVAIQQVVQYHAQRLVWQELRAVIDRENQASRSILEKCGFIFDRIAGQVQARTFLQYKLQHYRMDTENTVGL